MGRPILSFGVKTRPNIGNLTFGVKTRPRPNIRNLTFGVKTRSNILKHLV